MKKLKVALVAMFALSCSLFLFACNGGNEDEATLKSITVTGGTTEYYDVWANADASKHTAFSVGELVVTGKYDTEDEEKATQVLTSDQYEVDAAELKAAYEAAKAGSTIYTVTISADSGKKTVEATYTATISHQYEDGVCVNCGATNQTITIADSMVFPDWGSTDATTYTTISGEGSVYGELLNERWVKYGTIDRGQVYALSGTITPTNSEGWDTPMFAIAANGEGLAIRTDNWIIHAGNAMGGYANLYSTPLTDAGASAGTATVDSEDWVVYYAGPIAVTDTTCGGKDGTADFIYTVSYDENSIITINYTTILDGVVSGNATYSMKVPANVYDVLFFGEECKATITQVSITKEFEMTKLENEGALKKTVYAENTYIDRTGIKLIGTYSKGDPATITAYAIYGETEEGKATLLTNGDTLVAPVTIEMTKFYISFGDYKIDLPIKVVPSSIKGVTTSFDLTYNGVQFENSSASYVYDVNTSDKIALIGSGNADRLSAEQKEALGTDYDYYVAFHLYGENSEKLAEDITCSNSSAVVWYKDNGVNVILPVDSSVPASFTVTVGSDVTEETVVNVDLSAVKVPAISAVVISNNSTLDKGGNVEVWYYGYTADTVKDVSIYNIKAANYSDITAEGGYMFTTNKVVVSAVYESNILKVTYKLPALLTATVANPNLSVEFRVYGAGGSATSPDVLTTLTYNLQVSEELAEGWYKVNDTVYLVAAENAGTTTLSVVVIEDSRQLTGTVKDLLLNVGGTDSGLPYNISFSVVSDGKDAAKAVYTFSNDNLLTKNAQTTIGIIGSINDNTDGDYGAVYMVKLNVTSIFGLSMTDGFYAEITNTTRASNDSLYSFVHFTDKGAEVIEIDAETLTNAEIRSTQGSCVEDATRYFIYTDADNHQFSYGYTVTVPATGVHTWGEAVDGVQTCTVCGSTREKYDITEEGFKYLTLGTSVAVENSDTDGAWWNGGTQASVVPSGNFAIEYSWTNTRDTSWYQDAVIEIYNSSAQYFDMNFLCGGGWGDLIAGVIDPDTKDYIVAPTVHSTVWTLNGEEIAQPKQGDEAAGAYEGDYTALIVRVGSTLTITQTIVATSGDIYQAVDVFENFTTEDGLTILLTGNPYWIDDITIKTGSVQVCTYETFADDEYTAIDFEAVSIENADPDGVWWNGGTTSFSIPAYDFILVYTFENTRDTSWYQDAVIELYNSELKYFDMNFMCGGGTWGDLNNSTHTYSWTLNGEEIEQPKQGDEAAGAYEGDYTVVITRIGTTLTIICQIDTVNGDVYRSVDVVEDFTTDALTGLITGNPWWLDNIQAYLGGIDA